MDLPRRGGPVPAHLRPAPGGPRRDPRPRRHRGAAGRPGPGHPPAALPDRAAEDLHRRGGAGRGHDHPRRLGRGGRARATWPASPSAEVRAAAAPADRGDRAGPAHGLGRQGRGPAAARAGPRRDRGRARRPTGHRRTASTVEPDGRGPGCSRIEVVLVGHLRAGPGRRPGRALGGGAHLRDLRRTRIGSFGGPRRAASPSSARPTSSAPAEALRDLDRGRRSTPRWRGSVRPGLAARPGVGRRRGRGPLGPARRRPARCWRSTRRPGPTASGRPWCSPARADPGRRARVTSDVEVLAARRLPRAGRRLGGDHRRLRRRPPRPPPPAGRAVARGPPARLTTRGGHLRPPPGHRGAARVGPPAADRPRPEARAAGRAAGIDRTLVVPFDRARADETAEEFVPRSWSGRSGPAWWWWGRTSTSATAARATWPCCSELGAARLRGGRAWPWTGGEPGAGLVHPDPPAAGRGRRGGGRRAAGPAPPGAGRGGPRRRPGRPRAGLPHRQRGRARRDRPARRRDLRRLVPAPRRDASTPAAISVGRRPTFYDDGRAAPCWSRPSSSTSTATSTASRPGSPSWPACATSGASSRSRPWWPRCTATWPTLGRPGTDANRLSSPAPTVLRPGRPGAAAYGGVRRSAVHGPAGTLPAARGGCSAHQPRVFEVLPYMPDKQATIAEHRLHETRHRLARGADRPASPSASRI